MTLVLRDPASARSLCSVCSAEPGSFVLLSPGITIRDDLRIRSGIVSQTMVMNGRSYTTRSYSLAITIAMLDRYCYLLTPDRIGWTDLMQDKVLDWQTDEAALLNNDYAWAKCPNKMSV